MADTETKRIIEVEAKYETLADLRTALTDAKLKLMEVDQAVKDGNATYAEQEKAIAEVKAAQQEYNKAQSITVKEVTAAEGSYNDLVNQLARLKEKWKQAAPGSEEFKTLTTQVNKTKLQLENMDHSIGNWQRNVGNYTNSIKDAAGYFGTVGKNAANAIGGIQGMTAGLKAMSGTPVIAILGALVTILQKVKESFKSNEASAQALTAAFAPLKAVGDIATKMFQGLGEVVVKVAEWFGQLADKMGWVSDSMKERQALAQEDIRLQKEQREALMRNADAEREAAELRLMAADKNKYSSEERIKYLEKAGQKEMEIMKRNRDLAQREYEQIKAKNALTASSSEELDKEAEAYVKLQNVEKEYFTKTKETTSQVAELKSQLGVKTAEVWKGIKTEAEDADIEIEEIDLKAIIAKEKREESLTAKLRTERQKRALEELADEEQKQLDLNDISGNSERQRQADAVAIQEETNQKKLDLLRQFASEASEAGDVTAYLDYQKQAADLEYKIWLETKKKEVKQTEQTDQQKLASAQAYARGISSIMSVVAAVWTSSIKQQVEAGKITEEEGEKQFESVKALQYAVTWINTLSAVVSALADPTPLPYAVKAINAAAALASGIASTVQIASTSLGASTSATSSSSLSSSTGSSSSSSTTTASSGSSSSALASYSRALEDEKEKETKADKEEKETKIEVTVNSPEEEKEEKEPYIEVKLPEPESEKEEETKVESPELTPSEEEKESEKEKETKTDARVETLGPATPEEEKQQEVTVKVEQTEADPRELAVKVEQTAANVKQTATTAPAIEMDTPTTRIVQTQADKDEKAEEQKAQRVYVVYSDIEAAGKHVKVRENESQF